MAVDPNTTDTVLTPATKTKIIAVVTALLALLGISIVAVPVIVDVVATPAAEVIYDEGFKNGWTHYDSFVEVNTGARSGSKALSRAASAWDLLNLFHANLSNTQSLTFYVKSSVPVASFYISVGDGVVKRLPLPGSNFTKYEVKLSDITSKTNFTNIVLQADTASMLTYDDISITAATTPSPPAAVVDAGNPSTPGPVVDVPPATSTGRWVTAYYVGYERALLAPTSIDFTTMTHIVMGRVVPLSDGSLDTDFDIDVVAGPALAKQVAMLARTAGKKAILMVGGSGTEAGFVGASSAANRAKFVTALLKAMDAYGYDGLDLDWEPIAKVNEPTMLALTQALRTARPAVLLTVPVAWNSQNEAFFGANHRLYDQINVMSYSMADGPGAGWTGWGVWHSSALKGETATTPSSVSRSVDMYLKAGVPPAKLGVGIGAYGSCWSAGSQPKQVTTGRVISGDGTWSFKRITELNPSAQYDLSAEAPYSTSAPGCTFLSYENERSVLAKGVYATQKGLGGGIIWTLGQSTPALMNATKLGFPL